MLIRNALIENSETAKDLRIKDGVFMEIGSLKEEENEEVLDLKGKLLLPPFIESHVHLDTCLTAGDPCFNMSGTLFEGIECWSRRKEKLTAEDIRERVNKVVRMYAANGIQHIRSHVDITDPSLMAMKTLLKLKDPSVRQLTPMKPPLVPPSSATAARSISQR